MSAPHLIRLRGPWDCQVLHGGEPAGEPFRVRLPELGIGALASTRDPTRPIAGPVRLSRRFHRPTGLTPAHRVRLEFPPAATVRLNGTPLVAKPAGCGDLTEGLADRNLLELEFAAFPTPPVEVRLVIVSGPA